MTKLFKPISYIDKTSFKNLLISQIFGLSLLWFFSPFIFLPTPIETIKAAGILFNAGIITDIITSLYLNVEAIFIAIIISLTLSYLFTIPFFKPLIQGLSKLRFLSLVGLTFFFTLGTHNQHQLKISLLVFSVVVFLVTSMIDVVVSIPKEQFDLGRTLRMNNWELLKEVVIYGQIDKMFDCLRQNAAIGWMMLTMVEGLARSDGGIGSILLNENRQMHLADVMAIQLMILGLGLAQDWAIGFFKKQVCPYSSLTLEHK